MKQVFNYLGLVKLGAWLDRNIDAISVSRLDFVIDAGVEHAYSDFLLGEADALTAKVAMES